MTPGIYSIPNDQYHSSKGISRSAIQVFRKSPLHYWHKFLNPEYVAEKPTPAMVLGEALHCLVLEPTDFDKRYAVYKDLNRKTKEGKKLWKDLSGNLTYFPIHEKDFAVLDGMRQAIDNHPIAKKLIINSEYEQSIYWIDEETQLLCKCRPDIWANSYIADLKTTNDGSFNAFQRSIFTYGYDIQAAMCREGVKHTTGQIIDSFIFIVIEKEAPYAVAIYTLDKAVIDAGEIKFKQALKDLKHCFDSNEWASYSMHNICLPKWMEG